MEDRDAGSHREVCLSRPAYSNACPMGQQPNPDCKNNTDWSPLDIEVLPEAFIPRTNYQVGRLPVHPMGRYPFWRASLIQRAFGEAHREFVGTASVRTLQACLLPPGAGHVHAVISTARANSYQTAHWAGLLCSLPIDYLVKSSGASHLTEHVTDALPIPEPNDTLDTALLFRTLRLNCITSAYTPIWEELFDERWRLDSFVTTNYGAATVKLHDVDSKWSFGTPLRTDYDRWLAMCETDAIDTSGSTGPRSGQVATQRSHRSRTLPTNGRSRSEVGSRKTICCRHHGA